MSLRCENCSSETRTESDRNSSLRLRSGSRPLSALKTVSKPLSFRSATRAERSAGCSYAREEIPGKRLRCLLGTCSCPFCRWPSDMPSPHVRVSAFADPCAALCAPEAEPSLGGDTVDGHYSEGVPRHGAQPPGRLV